jgi:hypothetical protein
LDSVDQRITNASYRERADLGGGFRTFGGAAGMEAVRSTTASAAGTGGEIMGVAANTTPAVSAHGASHMAAQPSNAMASGPNKTMATTTIASSVRGDGLMAVKRITVPGECAALIP